MRSKVYFLGGIFGILFGILTSIQVAYGWMLTVNVSGVQVGHSSIIVEIKGPNGYKASNTVQNGQKLSTIFEVADDAVPVGSTYKACSHSEGVANTLPESCTTFIHSHDTDSEISLNVAKPQ